MRSISLIVVIIFLLLMFVPLLTLNTTPGIASEMDNRMLAENPFSTAVRNRPGADLTNDIDAYISDRIGFRDDMILANAVINYQLFGQMDHPTYRFGKDDYVFFRSIVPETFGDFHIAFADMVAAVQTYCEDRGVPFLFVFDPEKKAVYPEYLPEGIAYQTDWVCELFEELDKRNVNYIDNTVLLREHMENGDVVFNRQYNAGHWNDLGAFYGVNNILQHLQTEFPQIVLNTLDDFTIKDTLRTALIGLKFPIHETEPIFEPKAPLNVIADPIGAELELHPNYAYYYHTVNPEKQALGLPRTLVFQGSYMNGMGYKFFGNALGDYIGIHDYQNILNFPYYFNLLQPECVVLEVAEYTLNNSYFDYETMKNIDWNQPLSTAYPNYEAAPSAEIQWNNISIHQGDTLTKICWEAPQTFSHLWLMAGQEYDMRQKDGDTVIYEVTIPNEVYDVHAYDFSIVAETAGEITTYRLPKS